MNKRTFLINQCMRLFLVAAAITTGLSSQANAGAGVGTSTNLSGTAIQVPTYYANSPAGTWTDWAGNVHNSGAALRKFVDPLPGLCGPPGTPIPAVTGGAGLPISGKCIPVANPDKLSYPGSDYYEIGIVEYAEQMHADLPKATTLRGYVQLNDPANLVTPATAAANARYLGPIIVAQRGTPVRIKYTNLLPTGKFNGTVRNGDLFIPVDKTLMGAGTGPLGGTELYTENRSAVHLHGGDTPWISDGTPHQWLTPAGETTSYPNGASLASVPDMPIPTQGSGTLFYPNGDGARLMFYHDHALGITRLNVYAGVAAGYLIQEPAAETLLPAIPGGEIPLVLQDKTFVPQDVNVASGTSLGQDAKWNTTAWGAYGDLWFPHVYEINQDPYSFDGTNPVGRWDYGPWFWPVFPVTDFLPSGDYTGCQVFNGVNICGSQVTTTPEAFMDTPVVNGTAYPSLAVQPTAYRFRILNAANDRAVNLGLYTADPTVVTSDGRSNTEVRMVPFDSSYTGTFPSSGGLLGTGWGTPDARVGGVPDPRTTGPDILQIGTEGGLLPQLADIPSTPINYEYNKRSVTVLNVLEHGLLLMPAERADAVMDFSQFAGQTLILYNDAPAPLPAGDPRIDYYTGNGDQSAFGGTASTLAGFGPNTRTFMQIKVGVGTHANAGTISTIKMLAGGIGYSLTPSITISDGITTDTGTAIFGPGGVITAITPATPTNVYTVAPKVTITDLTGSGAIALVYLTPAPAFNAAALATALPQAYALSQPRPVVAESAYNAAFLATFPDQYAHIYTGASLQPQVTWIDGNGLPKCYSASGTCTNGTTTVPADGTIFNKAIQELFDPHGRMNATLGVELPFTSATTQTTIPLGYIDPATEMIKDGETQIWKITHNGVDSHPVHFHLVNVQVINRVGWDGTVKPPHPNEVGWKETVRMNPLEDILVAVRAKSPKMPFSIGNSSRALDPTQPVGPAYTMGFTQIDPNTGNPATVFNKIADFGWEYVWHCHILGHEENDFMRAFIFTGATNYNTADKVAPAVTATVSPAANAAGWNKANATVTLTAIDGPATPVYLASGLASINYSAAGAQAIASTTVLTPTVGVTPASVILPAVTTEGITTVSATATDQAATPNTTVPPFTVAVKIDKTAPVITGTRAPAANIFGWNNTNVVVTFTASDALSGIATLTAPITLSANGANQSRTGTATDVAGNSASATVSGISIDKTAPTIAVANVSTKNNSGGSTANVTVAGTVTDQTGLSGVDVTANAGTFSATSAGATTVTGAFTVAANGAYTFTANNLARKRTWSIAITAKDRAGNIGTVTRAVTLN